MYRVNMPNRVRALCAFFGHERYMVKNHPYCYRRCDRYIYQPREDFKDDERG